MSDKHAIAQNTEPQQITNHQDSGNDKNRRTTSDGRKTQERRKFIGFSERMEMQRKQRRDKPRPWIERKIVIPFVIGIAGYAWYVYIGRFCVPMLRRDDNAMGGMGMGVAFTIVFCLLGLMFWWTYIKLLFTHPGFANHYVQKTPTPQGEYNASGRSRPPPSSSRMRSQSPGDFHGSEDEHSGSDFIAGTPYAEISPPLSQSPSSEGPSDSRQHPTDLEKQVNSQLSIESSRISRTPSSTPQRKPSKKRTPSSHDGSRLHIRNDSHNSGTERNTDETAINVAKQVAAPTSAKIAETQQAQPLNDANPRNNEEGLPPPAYSRRPPTHPALLPEYRYCYACGLVKPMRTHHCRACGTCVLMFDHHCPWVGGCVGAHNHKFFINFLQWSTLWILWVFATLLGLQIKSGHGIDPEIIVIIAFAGFFSLFTVILLAAHIRMIIYNQTTVESLGVSSMREREQVILHRMVPMWNWSHSNVHRRRNTIRKEWDREWGNLKTEGNIWWLGDARTNWEYRMGKNWVGWILPVGKSEGDGLTYPTNPRFDKDGRWRRRSEWPPELQ